MKRKNEAFILAVCMIMVILNACGNNLSTTDQSEIMAESSAVSGEGVSGSATETVSGSAAEAVSGGGTDVAPSVDGQIDILIQNINLWCDECEFDEPVEIGEAYELEGLNDGKYCVTDMDEDGWLEIVQYINEETLYCQELNSKGGEYTMEYVDLNSDDKKTKKWADVYQNDVFNEHGEEVACMRIRQRPEPEWLKKRMKFSYKDRRKKAVRREI